MNDPRSLLRFPSIYNRWQRLVGAPTAWRKIAKQYLRLSDGQRVIDLGCGTSNILQYLPDVEYVGVDCNRDYLAAARGRYANVVGSGKRFTWICEDICTWSDQVNAGADLVMAVGVLHHLDNDQVQKLLSNARELVARGGRFVSIDPSFTTNQSRIARTIISLDRGNFVREHDAYIRMVRDCFPSAQASHHNDLLRIPFSMTIIDSGRVEFAQSALKQAVKCVQAA